MDTIFKEYDHDKGLYTSNEDRLQFLIVLIRKIKRYEKEYDREKWMAELTKRLDEYFQIK